MLEIEPHVGGVRALHVPSTGITDYAAVTAKYAEIAARTRGGSEDGRGSSGIRAGFFRIGRSGECGGGPNARGRFLGALCGELRGVV